ncbi:hypothetical protein ACX9P6_004362 [Citrobacter braakii]
MNIPRYQTPDTAAGELAALDTLKPCWQCHLRRVRLNNRRGGNAAPF